MPRTGDTYQLPPDVYGVPDQPILSGPYNSVLNDLAADANNARPISAGGTGAPTRQSAMNNLLDGTTYLKDDKLLIADADNPTRCFRLDVGNVPNDTTRILTMPSKSFAISDVVADQLGKPTMVDLQKALGISLTPIAKIGTTTATKADNAAFWFFYGSADTVNLAPAATLGAGWSIAIWNSGSSNLTIDPAGSETINGVPAIVVASKSSVIIACSGGTNFNTLCYVDPVIDAKIAAAIRYTLPDTQMAWTRMQSIRSGYSGGGQLTFYPSGGDNLCTIEAIDSSSLLMGYFGFNKPSGVPQFELRDQQNNAAYLTFTMGTTQYMRMGSYAYSPNTPNQGWQVSNMGVFDLMHTGYDQDRIRFLYGPSTKIGSITTTYNATSYNTSSDYRLKPTVENLVEFSLTADQFALLPDALRRVMALRPVRHNWSNAPAMWTHGFIAHEAQPIIPHAVTGEKDAVEAIGTAIIPERHIAEVRNDEGNVVEPARTVAAISRHDIPEREAPDGSSWSKTGERPVYQGIDTSKMVADLTAAIQGLTLLVLDQQARIAALEAR
nr:MAG TPA: endosialidase chaperone [Caudoviricetes sp.]DAK00507.1 MAG TPA: endosialidase chaperone [Caudoviricetes sp.]